MSEHHEPLIADPTSYVSPDGDVLPIADIESVFEPVSHDDIDPATLEALEAAESAQHAAELFWPVAEIPVDNPEVMGSENFNRAKAAIEEGIADSTARKLPQYLVKTWIKETHMHHAKRVEVTIPQYLVGTVGSSVSTEEYRALLAEFGPADQAYNELHKDEITTVEKKAEADATDKKIGGAATKAARPPMYGRGNHRARDAASAAAGDWEDDDE